MGFQVQQELVAQCVRLLGLSSVGLSAKGGVQTLSRVLAHDGLWRFSFEELSHSSAGLSMRLSTSKLEIVPPLESICAKISLAAHSGFVVQRASALLCDPSGKDCIVLAEQFICRGFLQITRVNVSRQPLEPSCPSCARCFPWMSLLPLGAATTVTPVWIAPLCAT